MDGSSPQERFEELVRNDPRFHPEAYKFVYDALDHTVRLKYTDEDDASEPNPDEMLTHETDPDDVPPASQHVTGHDLLEGLRLFALEEFGCMAATVFDAWGVRRSEDFGEIVFNLVAHGLMGKQESDSKEDFSGGYGGRTFYEVFQVRPIIEYCPERDEWKTSYVSAKSVGSG